MADGGMPGETLGTDESAFFCLRQMLRRYAEENVTGEQAERVVARVIAVIREKRDAGGRFEQ